MNDLPRVTDIIKFAGLMPDYERYSNGNYLEKGTAVDLGARYLFEGYKVSDLDDTTEGFEKIWGYLTSLEEWIEHTHFKAKRIQQEWIHPLGFIGHEDVDDDELSLDTKTGAKAKWHRVQTSAYLAAAIANNVQLKRRGSLYLQQDGSIAKFEEHTDRADWGAFCSALKLYQGEKALEQYRDNIKRWLEA